ncbi:polyprenol phosphomannose-dependent alpha 1,6 mannosyltransferase MptB [Nocardioides jiangxiensis]|uniref:Polyprenol phosphomannose-dependent alpha 1,6 mannosyltransferase MptB n=1 Tax=Nocardioides jiangxiensis TaxID=3064524 RepID=A0ABT9B1C5_9ACTN|nr:polyprenol phosphomannose-dependent alpha 1,6 mannosyltransferase MptB [Nocardioides sp. WY-20]MDO7868644.1 polyprenol phosphomannose-dependent alpha 1,6 mannosyltransferase MptB [Nocardioides sp. WY-20]
MLTRGLAGSVLVLIGGLVVSTLPDSSFLLDSEQVVALRTHPAGRMLGLAVVLAGLGMLAAAWLSLCRSLARSDRPGGLELVRQATVLWALPLLVAPPLFSRDGWSYAAQGTMTRLGISPYEHGPGVLAGPIVEAVDPRWMETLTPYGPLPLILGDLSSRLTTNPWALVICDRVVALAGLALIAWAVPRLAAWSGVRPALASAVAIASPLMIANGVGGLHNDLLMVGLMAAALVVGIERGWLWGAVVGGLAASVKVPGGLVCIPIVLASLPAGAPLLERVKRLGLAGAVAGSVLAAVGFAWGLGLGWVSALSVPGTVYTPLSPPTFVGGIFDQIGHLVGMELEEHTFADAFRKVASLLSLVLVGAVALRWPTGSRLRALEGTALLVGGFLLTLPVVHIWYLMWVVPFLAAMRLPRAASVVFVAVSVVGGMVAPLDSSLHGAWILIIMGSMYVALATAVLMLSRFGRERVRHIAEVEWLPAVR